MKKIYYVTALVAGMLSLASCNDNEPGGGGNTPTNPQEGINFNIGLESATSRTKYAPNDWLQIEWVKDDKITICCDQTQAPKDADKTKPGYLDDSNWEKKTSAVYKVTKVIAENHTVPVSGGEATITNNSKAMIAVNGEETPLYWGKNNPDGSQLEHTFYAGYGENIKIDPSSGVATCMYDPEQILEYEDSTDTWINMKQAYMVAYTEPMTPRDDVSLKFKPIMTTLEIDVQGPQGSGDVTITAIEITIPKDQDKISTITGSSTTTPYAYFEYDIKGKTCPTVSSPKEEKMVFTLKTPKKVSAGGIVKITAILPPIIINSDNQLTITVDATNGINTAKFATGVATSAKAVIKTADWEITSKLPELVDLGLPSGTRWAKWNLGASKPEEYGDHFGWGCTVPYASSAYVGEDKGDLSLYFRKIGGSGTAMSHCGSDKDPLKNIANIACTEYDAAHVRLGGGDWHMPTQAEVYELIVNCNWAWTDNYEGKGAKGYIVTSKINNSSIFLPLAGRRESVNHNNPNSGGYYWNSTPSSVNNYDACRIYLNSSEHKWSSYRRYNGHSIRPV
ncbi:MAG: hypothetical protein HUJ98_01560, partial [Bacteroidaceae bacterium]|nr:hypothetical protein [Bacteroidaceae bacterium]